MKEVKGCQSSCHEHRCVEGAGAPAAADRPLVLTDRQQAGMCSRIPHAPPTLEVDVVGHGVDLQEGCVAKISKTDWRCGARGQAGRQVSGLSVVSAGRAGASTPLFVPRLQQLQKRRGWCWGMHTPTPGCAHLARLNREWQWGGRGRGSAAGAAVASHAASVPLRAESDPSLAVAASRRALPGRWRLFAGLHTSMHVRMCSTANAPPQPPTR